MFYTFMYRAIMYWTNWGLLGTFVLVIQIEKGLYIDKFVMLYFS